MRALRRNGLMVVVAVGLLAGFAGGGDAADGPRVLVLGLDGLDPQLVARFRAEGMMPTVDRLVGAGWDLRELGTSIPPQSPVAWSTFITGANPGVHGLFDFIHRDPQGPAPYLAEGHAGRAFWQDLADAGIDATVFKVPANYPPVECEARTLSGMGTPDLLGTLGLFTYVTDDPLAPADPAGGRVVYVSLRDGRATTAIEGPADPGRPDAPPATLDLAIAVDRTSGTASLTIAGGAPLDLAVGAWSDWVSLAFPGGAVGIVRLHLMEVAPRLRLYVTPIQLDPRRPAHPISTPPQYARELAEALGPYYTQGLPEDTKALDEGVFTDADYVQQSDLVLAERRAQLRHELARFARLDRGFLFFYFNAPDQTCHTFWRGLDPDSPTHDGVDPDHVNRVRDLYAALDATLGEAVDLAGDDAVIIVMSDHGFAPFRRNVHLNAWLLAEGYLALKPGYRVGEVEFLAGVDWPRTRAYALGINGLYLNLKGREARGVVRPGAEADGLLGEIAGKLTAMVDPEVGQPAVKYAYLARDIYRGPLAGQGPDIVVGYHRGWRGSNASALGGVGGVVFDDNTQKWSGDHCMAADEVPGVILSNRRLLVDDPELRDLAPTILGLFGVAAGEGREGRDLLGVGHPEEQHR